MVERVWWSGPLGEGASGGKKGKLCRFTSRAGKCKSSCRSRNRWTGKRTAWFERAQPCFLSGLTGGGNLKGKNLGCEDASTGGRVENGDRRGKSSERQKELGPVGKYRQRGSESET